MIKYHTLEESAHNKYAKEFYYYNGERFSTILFHIDENKFAEFIKYLHQNYTYVDKQVKLSQILTNEDLESFNNDPMISVLNLTTVERTSKGNIFKKETTTVTYGDVEIKKPCPPIVIDLANDIKNNKYLDLILIYNYIIKSIFRDLSKRKKLYSISDDIDISHNKNTIPRNYILNKRETVLTTDELIDIFNRLFDTFVIDGYSEENKDNVIEISTTSSVEDLLHMREKIMLAKNNTDIMTQDLSITVGDKIRIESLNLIFEKDKQKSFQKK